ncbi:MAG: non-heme iron oxygenase ferredoxin subunit [Actinomycetota bacterium]|nr:non-heme iron oxygenase ferredoxin subunit [Actinomycetota bacterium]
MSDFVRACRVDEVPEMGTRRVEIDGIPICIAKAEGGEIYAIYDVCSHADVSLSEGDVEDTTIECWLHGSRFDLTSGRPTGLPATRPVPVYPTKIDGDEILVRLKES